uniref:Vacuolar protein-sorting-associated protein 33 homolog isoform X1 n=1 Tax=Rhizophora mucronata TaxID=61149 RepID=A0A2P2LXN5_RHIMU
MEEILKLLPGPHSETKKSALASSPSFNSLRGTSAAPDRVADGRRSLVLVVFIGGVTFAEISALRFLSAQEGMAYDLVIGTTKIVTGNTLAETYMDKLG